MANQSIIAKKSEIVDEIADKMKNASSYILFEYRGLTVAETNELRRKLKEANAEFKIYKNTLTKRALDKVKVNLDEHLNGPKAIAFGSDSVGPVKTLADFAKTHKALEIKAGVIDGSVADQKLLSELATIPSREALLTMLAGGLMGVVRDLSISLDLYSQKLEK